MTLEWYSIYLISSSCILCDYGIYLVQVYYIALQHHEHASCTGTVGGIEMQNGAAGSGEQPRKRRKASHGKAERLLLLKLAGAARRARAIHAHLHGVGTTGAPDAADVILATLEQGHPLLTSQLTIGSTEFEEVDPTSLFSPESGVERVDHIVLDNVQRLHGDAVPTALAACTATDEDVAHWGGPFSAELRALTLGDHVPRIKVMRCI